MNKGRQICCLSKSLYLDNKKAEQKARPLVFRVDSVWRLLIILEPADRMDDFCSIAEDKSPLLEGEDTAIHLPFLGGGKLLPFFFLPASLAQELVKFFLPFVDHRPLTGVIGIEVTDSDRLTIQEIVLIH